MDGSQSLEATFKGIESAGLKGDDAIWYFKQNYDYNSEAKYLDSINPRYAYDYYNIRNKYGTKKSAMQVGILASGLPEDEQRALLNVVGMKSEDLKDLLGKLGIE